MGIIITYDLSDKNKPVKDEMIEKKGYSKTFLRKVTKNGEKVSEIVYLPETTLYHISKTAQGAVEELESVAKKHDVKVTRCISVQLDGAGWYAIKGEPIK